MKNISGKAAHQRRVSVGERDPAAKRLSLRVLIIYEMSIRRPRAARFFIFGAGSVAVFGVWNAAAKGVFR